PVPAAERGEGHGRCPPSRRRQLHRRSPQDAGSRAPAPALLPRTVILGNPRFFPGGSTNPTIATAACALAVLGLFLLDRDKTARSSWAIWLPVIWVSLSASRTVSQWLQMGPLPTPDQIVEGNPLDRNIQTLMLFAGLFVLGLRWKALPKLLAANWPILLFFAYCAVSIAWSDSQL